MTYSANHESKSNGTSNGPHRRVLPSSSHLHQQPLFGRPLIAVGILMGIIGVLEMLIVFPLGGRDAESYFLMLPEFLQNIIVTIIVTIPEGTPILLLALPGALMLVASRAVVKRGRRHLVRVYEASEPHVIETPILYLRPFVADESAAQFVRPLSQVFFPLLALLDKRVRTWTRLETIEGITRYEELLAFAFRRVGTFVAIGDPRESLPLLGATRIYSATSDSTGSVDEETWKREVERQIVGAQLILLQIGISEGLRWEVKRVVQLADPQRVVLCVNPPRKVKSGLRNLYNKALRAEIKELWSQLRNSFEGVFPHELPEVIDDARFIKFDSDWTPRPVQPTKRKLAWFMPGLTPDLSRKTIDSTLAWLTWMMVPEAFGRRFLRTFINYVTYIISVIVVIVLLMFGLAAIIDALR